MNNRTMIAASLLGTGAFVVPTPPARRKAVPQVYPEQRSNAPVSGSTVMLKVSDVKGLNLPDYATRNLRAGQPVCTKYQGRPVTLRAIKSGAVTRYRVTF